jgi:uncharacterized membrane protein YeaQ/YmgE (transglycosylase-associated protein family)
MANVGSLRSLCSICSPPVVLGPLGCPFDSTSSSSSRPPPSTLRWINVAPPPGRLDAGWLAGQVMRGVEFGLLGNVLLGMAGALLAVWLFPGFLPITGIAGAIVQSAIRAIIVLAVVGLIKRVAT